MRKLIWTCNEGSCGGYADRLKGIVTAYLMAEAVGREFFIEWNGITNLQDAFYSERMWDGEPGGTSLRLIDKLETESEVSNAIRLAGRLKDETVYISINQYDAPHWEALGTDIEDSMPKTFAHVLDTLLAPRRQINCHPEYLAALQFLKTYKPVGVQVRTGEYHNEDGVTCADTRDVLARVLRDRAPAMFIASDSPFWKDHLAGISEIPSYRIRFAPAHIERSEPEDIRRTFLLTVIEHQILSKCSKVYTGWGGFGRTAAWWGRKPCVDLLLPPAESEGRVVDIGS